MPRHDKKADKNSPLMSCLRDDAKIPLHLVSFQADGWHEFVLSDHHT